MIDAHEKEPPQTPVPPVSPVSPSGTMNFEKPLPGLKDLESNPHQHPIPLGIPKRKPVPVSGAGAPAAIPEKPPVPQPGACKTKRKWLNLNWNNSSTLSTKYHNLTRKRKLIIAAAVAAILLLALIVGVAVGLTVGKKKSNLPLPSAHGGPYTGDLTYYDPGLGACGITSFSSEMICAVSHVLFDAASTGSNPNANPLCGLKVRAKRGEVSVDVKIVDRCVGCKETDLDVSEAVFKQLADLDLGRVMVEWSWLESAPVSIS